MQDFAIDGEKSGFQAQISVRRKFQIPVLIVYLNFPCFEPLKKFNFQMGVICTLRIKSKVNTSLVLCFTTYVKFELVL